MKLTAEMFDFEKYDYFDELKPEMAKGAEWLDYSGNWAPLTRHVTCLCRKLKPPPRYILLNEGEALQAEDQRLLVDYPRKWASPLVGDGLEYGPVLPGEVWRRPTDDLAHANQRLQREIESLEREVVELQLKIKNFDKSGEE